MTLIESKMVPCTKLTRSTASDGKLGRNVTYEPGGSFSAAIIRQQPSADTKAEKLTFHDEYTIVVPTGTALSFHQVFKRDSDGAVFRVTGDLRDTEAPEMSTVQIAKTTAERITIDGEIATTTTQEATP